MSIDLPSAVGALWDVMTVQMFYASVIFAVAWILTRRLARRSPGLLYGIWGLVILRLVLPVDLASPISLATAFDRLAAQVGPSSEQAVELISPATALSRTHLHAAGPSVDGWPMWPTLLLLAWATAAILFAARIAKRRRPYRQLARQAPEVEEPVATHLLNRWRAIYGIRRPVRLVSQESHPFTGPFTLGTLRPTVFVPSSVLRRPQLLEVTLAHELAHVSRFDDLRLCFQEAVRALWIGFPLVHLATAAMRRERERICDQLATSQGRLSRGRYLAALQTLLREGLTPAVAVPGLGSAEPSRACSTRKPTMRFDSLLSDPRPTSRSGRLIYWAMLVLLLPMAPMAPSAIAESPSPADPPTVAPASIPTRPAPALLEKMINPLPGEKLTSGFGNRKNPFDGQTVFHDGVDVHAGPSSKILAPADGLVELATEKWEGNEAWGTVLILDHGQGVKTRYAHLESLGVKAGDRVEQGQVVGVPGSTGKSTGRHLHFEIWQGDQRIDPASVIPGWQ